MLLDVGLNLLCVHTGADLGQTERHRPTFRHERQERAPLLGVAVREQRPGADRELTRDLHCERSETVRGQRFLDGGERAIRRVRTAELDRHGVAETALGGHGFAQRGRQLAVRRERLAAREATERRIDHGALGAGYVACHFGAGLKLRDRGSRTVDESFDEARAARRELSVDGLRRSVQGADVARGVGVTGGGECSGGCGEFVVHGAAC